MIRIIFALILMTGVANASTFIEGLEDVPIMDGLKQTNESDVSFGNEESRFIEIYLESTKTNFAKVKSFYQKTLPQLGWTHMKSSKNALSFNRENEVIEIVREETSPLRVRLTVKSRH